MIINLKEAFTYMFKDENFSIKYLIGTALILFGAIPSWILYPQIKSGQIPFVFNLLIMIFSMFIGIFTAGFGANYANTRIRFNENLLPDWIKDISKIVTVGFKEIFGQFLFGFVSFCAILPIFLILAFICAIIFGIIVGPSISSLSSTDPAFEALVLNFVIITFIILSPLLILWGIFLLLSKFSFLTDLKFASFFNLKKMVFLLKGNFLNFLIIIGISIVYGIAVNLYSYFANYHIYFATMLPIGFYGSLVFYNLYAQFTQIGLQNNYKRAPKQEKAQEIIKQDLEN